MVDPYCEFKLKIGSQISYHDLSSLKILSGAPPGISSFWKNGLDYVNWMDQSGKLSRTKSDVISQHFKSIGRIDLLHGSIIPFFENCSNATPVTPVTNATTTSSSSTSSLVPVQMSTVISTDDELNKTLNKIKDVFTKLDNMDTNGLEKEDQEQIITCKLLLKRKLEETYNSIQEQTCKFEQMIKEQRETNAKKQKLQKEEKMKKLEEDLKKKKLPDEPMSQEEMTKFMLDFMQKQLSQ